MSNSIELNDANKSDNKMNSSARIDNNNQLDDLTITNEHIDTIIQAVEDVLNGRPLTKTNIFRVVANVMSVSAKMKDLPNRLKKKVVMTGFERFLLKQNLTDDVREGMLLLLQESVDPVIDVIADVDNKVIQITKNSKCCIIL